MSKLIALAAVVAAVLLPAAANAATTTKLSGVVVSKQTTRHTLVVASSHGNVTTVRATVRQFRATPLGSRISAIGTKLADGSLHATRITHTGRTKKAHIRVTVLKTNGAKLLVAGGGSAFALRLGSKAQVHAAARSGPKPGDQIETDVKLSHGGLVGSRVADHRVVRSDRLLGEGHRDGRRRRSRSPTTACRPWSRSLTGSAFPRLVKVGSEVEIVASVSGATLTLVAIKIDGDGAESGDDGGSSVGGDSIVHVEGFVTSLDAGSITIQPGHSASPGDLRHPRRVHAAGRSRQPEAGSRHAAMS